MVCAVDSCRFGHLGGDRCEKGAAEDDVPDALGGGGYHNPLFPVCSGDRSPVHPEYRHQVFGDDKPDLVTDKGWMVTGSMFYD